MNDEQLFACHLNGDASAFSELYQRYRGRLEGRLRSRGVPKWTPKIWYRKPSSRRTLRL